jgi:predicted transcriptional regulator of viral defense system
VEKKVMIKKTLSTKEIELISRLEFYGKEIYAKKEIISFCGDEKLAAYLIKKLLEKDRLRKIIKNIYLFIPMKAPGGLWAGNEYLIAKALARGANYYIGYAAVFNSYGFTDQVAQMIQIINDKYSIRKTFLGVRYELIKALPNRFFGLETRKIKNEDIVFPTKERAMIDVFGYYDTRKAFAALKDQLVKLNMPLFVEFLIKYPVLRVRRRVGFFLEKLGVDKKLLSKIDVGEKGYTHLYDTGSNKGEINNIWRIIING